MSSWWSLRSRSTVLCIKETVLTRVLPHGTSAGLRSSASGRPSSPGSFPMEPLQQVYSPLRQGDCPHLGPQSPGPEFSGPASAHHLFSQQLLTQWQLALNCCLLPSHSPGGPSTPLAAPSFSFIGFSSQHRHVGLAWGPVFRPLISLTPQWADLATWIYIPFDTNNFQMRNALLTYP